MIEVPLLVNQREARILDSRLQARGKLANATRDKLLRRLAGMRRDSRWHHAQTRLTGRARSKALRELRDEYGLSSNGARRIAFDHWQASQWMARMFGSRIALAVGTEVWTGVKNHMLGHTGKPGFPSSAEMNVLWGNDNKASLVLKVDESRTDGNKIGWARVELTSSVKRKNLSLRLARDWRPGTRRWSQQIGERRIVRVGIKREEVRGQARWFALICLEGQPYRNPEYLTQVASTSAGKVVGLDVGPSLLAVMGQDESLLINRAPRELLEARKREAARLRRAQRALERSRRATNPDCFDEQGRFIKGKKITVKSKRYQQLQSRLKREARSARLNRERDAVMTARQVMGVGNIIARESNSYRAWQASMFGRRMGFTAPGALMNRIAREADLTGGRAMEFQTSARIAPSQYCLCGSKQKKPLSQRYHYCTDCGLGINHETGEIMMRPGQDGHLDRDLFSALLVRLLGQERLAGREVENLSEGPFQRLLTETGTDGVKGMTGLCSVAVAAPSLTGSALSESGSNANPAVGLVAARPSAQTPGQEEGRRHRARTGADGRSHTRRSGAHTRKQAAGLTPH